MALAGFGPYLGRMLRALSVVVVVSLPGISSVYAETDDAGLTTPADTSATYQANRQTIPSQATDTTAPVNSSAPVILVLGDSLSGAYGMSREQGWVAHLQSELIRRNLDFRVINASVSGDTTRMGLGRINDALNRHKPAITIIALGGNDGLRGLGFDEIESSLTEIITRCQDSGSRVLLAGVRLPPNYGPVYNREFAGIYTRLAEKYNVPLVPRILQDVADDSSLMQADGIHPTAAAQPKVMQNIWQGLQPLL